MRLLSSLLFLSLVALLILQHAVSLDDDSTPEIPIKGDCPEGPILSHAGAAKSRLGNQMTRYANVWTLSQVLGRPAYLPYYIRDTLSLVFNNLSVPALEDVEHCNIKFDKPIKPDPRTENAELKREGNLMLHEFSTATYLQLKYLQQLKKEFRFRPEIEREVQRTMAEANPADNERVGVHVRRQDYLRILPQFLGYSVVDEKFYLDAMQWFRDQFPDRNFTFLVVSDDDNWVRKNLHGDDIKLVSRNPGHDMALMASCSHSIVDYGAFSHWNAMLASASGGHTITLDLEGPAQSVIKKLAHNWHFFDPANYSTLVKKPKKKFT